MSILLDALRTAGTSTQRVATNIRDTPYLDRDDDLIYLVDALYTDHFQVSSLNDRFTRDDRDASREARDAARKRLDWRNSLRNVIRTLLVRDNRFAIVDRLAAGEGSDLADEMDRAAIAAVAAFTRSIRTEGEAA